MAPLKLALALALAALVATGCTSEQRVFGLPELTNCDEARFGSTDDLCLFAQSCLWREAADGCCTTVGVCRRGELVRDTACRPDCTTCVGDFECAFGQAICVDGVCGPCPPTGQCPPCPAGWQPLHRNGCATCECAPPPQCDFHQPNSCPDGQCYPSERCAPDCSFFDCCANVCSAPGCTNLAPEGCATPCSKLTCSRCALEDCACDAGTGTWICHERCLDGQEVTPSCSSPAPAP